MLLNKQMLILTLLTKYRRYRLGGKKYRWSNFIISV